jgi:DhnA family fructose-bisphosphate aldolase class Ia
MIHRLNRLFAADGRCLDVAIDHGFFGEASFLRGIEDMPAVVRTVVAAGPDAIQLSPGQAPLLLSRRVERAPALVLRTDIANVYGREGTAREYLFSQLIENAVEQAVVLDAACVVVNLLSLPEHAELFHQCVRNISALRAACDSTGMPLMVEPLAMLAGPHGYGTNRDLTTIVTLVRQAAELGADVIKADATEDAGEYGAVVEAASGRPVLVRGGDRVDDDELLRRTRALMDAGAAGIVYGRNVIQHADPQGITRALMSIVHATVADEALAGA